FLRGPERGDVHYTLDAALGGGFGNRTRAFHVQRIEILIAALAQHRHKIYDCIGAFERGVERLRKARSRLHELNLTNIAHHAQISAKMRAAHGDADTFAALGERTHDLLPDEARAAEHNDQFRHEALHKARFSRAAR